MTPTTVILSSFPSRSQPLHWRSPPLVFRPTFCTAARILGPCVNRHHQLQLRRQIRTTPRLPPIADRLIRSLFCMIQRLNTAKNGRDGYEQPRRLGGILRPRPLAKFISISTEPGIKHSVSNLVHTWLYGLVANPVATCHIRLFIHSFDIPADLLWFVPWSHPYPEVSY